MLLCKPVNIVLKSIQLLEHKCLLASSYHFKRSQVSLRSCNIFVRFVQMYWILPGFSNSTWCLHR